jgi:cyclic-di-GMP phosphodiesterase, flagellum assembly factor TipF
MQIVYFACYTFMALLVALSLPYLFTGLPRSSAWLAGFSIFLAGGLIHEIVARRHGEARELRRLMLLHRSLSVMRDDLASLSGRVAELESRDGAAQLAISEHRPTAQRLSDTPRAVAPAAPYIGTADGCSGPTPTRSSNPEERMLHALVERLSRPGDGTTPMVGREGAQDFDAIRTALRDDKLDIYLQPIVALPQRKRRYFDCALYLGSDHGAMVPPRRYREIASRAGYGASVESMRLFRTVQFVRDLAETPNGFAFFCELSTHSLRDTGFFEDLLAFLSAERNLAERLVFQSAAPAIQHADDLVWERLERMTKAGYRLSLDEAPQLEYDAAGLAGLGVRFVRIDAGSLLTAAREDLEAIRARRHRKALAQAGVEVIVANIDSERMLVELLDLDIDLGQGALFGDYRRSAEMFGETGPRRRE